MVRNLGSFCRLVHRPGTLEEIDKRRKVSIGKSLRKAMRLNDEIAI